MAGRLRAGVARVVLAAVVLHYRDGCDCNVVNEFVHEGRQICRTRSRILVAHDPDRIPVRRDWLIGGRLIRPAQERRVDMSLDSTAPSLPTSHSPFPQFLLA